ncbi:MAG: hypothetical protein LBC46_00490 [Treponema sp.]|nr:hypothetical protein [Treponema sp.]
MDEETLQKILDMDPAMRKLYEEFMPVARARDEDSLRYYQMREKALSDFISGMNFARKEGEQKGKAEGLREGRAEGLKEGKVEGLKEGERKGKQELARNMKAGGLSVEQIMAFSGFSRKEIEEL